MNNTQAIRMTKRFTDFYGQDLSDTTNMRSKEDCIERLQSHRDFLEAQHADALKHIDNFINDLEN